MTPRTSICLSLILLAVATPLPAQQGDVAALRAGVAQLRDTSELRVLERTHEGAETAYDQLIAGFAALRLWELTERPQHAERSRRHFDRAADLDPNSAWAHYGHALSLQPEISAGPGVLVTDDVLGRALGINPISRARRALERAVTLDPALPGAAELLAKYASATTDASAQLLARRALTDVTSAPDAPTGLLLALARTAREQGQYADAAAAAGRAHARRDSAYARASLELARALASVEGERAAAGEAYLAALESGDEALLAELWQDAAIILRDADRELWQRAATDEGKRAAVRTFWALRGALAASTPWERAAEHYARLNFAGLHHRRWGQYGAAPPNAYRWEKIDAQYADRGIIYIRHGEPDHVWQTPMGDYVVWFYRDEAGGPLSFHFIRYGGRAGWSKDPILVRWLPCMDPELALHDPRLRPLAYGCSSMQVAAVSATVRADVARALRTDSDAPRFDTAIPFHYDLYTFRGPAGATVVVASIGVPADTLPRPARPLRFGLAVVDTARYTSTLSSTSVDPPTEAGESRLLRVNLTTSTAPASAAAYRVTVRDAEDRAGMVYGGPLEVPDYRGTGPLASDIVLAEPDVEGGFVRGPHRLALAPTQVFPGGRFRVFYELYNLPAGAPYRTELRIERTGRSLLARLFGGGDPLGLDFDEVAPESNAEPHYQLREVTAPLAPGSYVLRVRVRTAAGVVERERRFTVPER